MSPSGSLDPATVLTHKPPRLALDPTDYRTLWGAQDCCILYYCGWFIHPRPAPSPCVVIAWENSGGSEPPPNTFPSSRVASVRAHADEWQLRHPSGKPWIF